MKTRVILAILCLVKLCACKTDPLASMPSFSYRMADSVSIAYSKDIPDDKPIVLIHFEADCTDCQRTTDSLLQNMEQLKNTRFYFLSTERFSQVTLFRKYYKLDQYSNITVGQDFAHFLPTHFKTPVTPYIALYNSNKDLVGMYKGKPNISILVAAIKAIQ
jgi:hypothetical protein